MEDLLLRFQNEIVNNPQAFLASEAKKFPSNYSEEDKVKSEFMSLHSYYHDKNSNEGYFDSNQDFVIQEALGEIQELIGQKDYNTAAYYIVSLQLLMGIEVRFSRIVYNMIQNSILVSDFVDKEKYLGNSNPYTNRKGK